ncbi:MAG: polyvinylalcohol dehydrogenase, partial [Planctomycetaceae bacterium]
LWMRQGTDKPLETRVPGTDHAPGADLGTNANVIQLGKVIRSGAPLPASDAQPQPSSTNALAQWPQFRGPARDGISRETCNLARTWQAAEPRELWGLDVGEGYAGAAVFNGRVYLMDYDREKKMDALRCLSLDTGQEHWRFSYPVSVKRNHGMYRTVPAVTDKLVVAMGPKCHVVCLDSTSGDLRWGVDLVRQHGATVPPWYAGQCPLMDGAAVILAPGGKNSLLIALEAETGKVIWQTPNPRGWKMTHSSIMPMEFAGERMYVYCADKGVVGVSATNGAILWQTTDWKISIANVPSPLVLEGGRVFLSGGYNAGSAMLQLKKEGSQFTAQPLFRLQPEIFGATQHTPILYEDHIYGVRPDGRFACLTLEGKTVWASASGQQFGLGPFLVSQGLIYAVNDSGLLRLIEATPEKYKLLGQSQVLKGRESWGPLALAGGRLLARDLTRLVCLEVGRK